MNRKLTASFTLSEPEKEILLAWADRLEVSFSELMRLIIKESIYLNKFKEIKENLGKD